MSSTIISTAATAVVNATASTASCITVTPDKNGYVPIEDCRNIWPYYPSFGAAIVFTILFGIAVTLHIFQAFHYRKAFCWVIIMAAIWEFGGFLLRILATRHQLSLGLYMPEELLILLAPLWVNAFDYMILGRMIYYFLPEKRVFGIEGRKFTLYFVSLDIVSFLVQGTGGSIASGGPNESPDTIMLGIHVYMGGIGLQEFFILCFMAMAIRFHRRMLVLEKEGPIDPYKPNWRPLLYALYGSLTCITVRIIYRLVEYSGGVNSAIPTHEVYFYVFEAVPMVIAIWLMVVIHPGRTLRGPDSEFPKETRAQKKEEKRLKKEAKRAKKEAKKARKAGIVIDSSSDTAVYADNTELNTLEPAYISKYRPGEITV